MGIDIKAFNFGKQDTLDLDFIASIDIDFMLKHYITDTFTSITWRSKF